MRSLTVLSLALLVSACGGAEPAASGSGAPVQRGRAPSPTAESVQATEAAELGRELFDIMDQVMAFKSSHFNRFPKDLPAMGIDSLTRATVRRLTFADGVPTLNVVYRRAEGRTLKGCVGTNKVLEDSMLNGGAFEVNCTLLSGEAKAFTVGG